MGGGGGGGGGREKKTSQKENRNGCTRRGRELLSERSPGDATLAASYLALERIYRPLGAFRSWSIRVYGGLQNPSRWLQCISALRGAKQRFFVVVFCFLFFCFCVCVCVCVWFVFRSFGV